MADLGSPLPKPRMGIAGNPESLPQIERQVKTDAVSQPVDYASSLNNLATTPSALSSFATNLMVSSSNALMDKWGYEQGKDPHGELLPAITNADTRFNQAYTNQANATLTLNGNKMFMDAQEELNREYKLTPQLINSYSQKMTEGAEDLLKLAPSGLKPELQNNFASTILKSSHELNQKMIGQQKQQYLDHMNTMNDLHTSQIFDFAKIGSDKGISQAMTMTNNQIALNNSRVANGEISESSAKTKNDAIEVAFMSGGNIAEYNRQGADAAAKFPKDKNKALFAQEEAKIKFLSDMADKKPEGVSTEKWQQVEKAVLQEVSNRELMRKRDQQLTQQEFEYKSANNMVTDNDIDDIKQKLDPILLLQTLTKFSVARGKLNATQTQQNELMQHWGEPESGGLYTNPIKNQTYSRMVKATIQKALNDGLPKPDEFQASIDVARSAGFAVPRFQDELNAMILSGDGNKMQAALTAEHLVGSGKAGLSKKADDMKWHYLGNIGQGMSQLEAGARALQEVGNLDDKALETLAQNWKQYENQNFATPKDKMKFAQQLSGFGDDWFFQLGPFSTETIYKDVMVDKMINAYRSNWIGLHGNESAAMQKTKYNLENSMGHTFANGEKQWTFAPLEKITGLPEGGATTRIIQADVRSQVSPQLEATKQAYDAGNVDYYYRLKEPEDRLATPGLNVSDRDQAIQIERVNRSSRKEILAPTLTPDGLIKKGNIDLSALKKLSNKDGTESTVSTITAEFDGHTFILPTVIDGKRLSEKDAIQHFKDTKKHLGEFKTTQDADLYDEALHKQQGWMGKNKWPEVFKDGETTVYDLEITPSPTMGSNINFDQTQQIEYDVSIRSQAKIGVHKGINFPWLPDIYYTPEGAMESIVPFGNQPGIAYRPNIQKLHEDYLKTNGINPEQQTLQEARDKAYDIVRAQHRREEKLKVRNPYPTM